MTILTRVGSYHSFSAQLSHCCSQLVLRQPSLAAPIYQVPLLFDDKIIMVVYNLTIFLLTLYPKGLLRYWPTTDSSKQLLFLEEIDQMLVSCKPPPSLLTPLRRKVSF